MKKGVFFTLMALLIIELIVTAYIISLDISIKHRMDTVSERIEIANMYDQKINAEFVSKLTKVMSYKAAQELMGRDIEYDDIEDFYKDFSELLVNGTFNNAPVPAFRNYSLNYTLRVLSNALDENLHISAAFSPKGISISQSAATGPWQFAVNFTYSYNITTDVADWRVENASIVAYVPIAGLKDPYFAHRGFEDANRYFSRSYSEQLPGSERSTKEPWDIFNDYIDNGTYRYEPKAPSFFERIVGGSDASECCGVESFINPEQTDDFGSNRDESYADYCFYGGVCRKDEYDVDMRIYRIEGLPTDWARFKLDSYHAKVLDIENKLDKGSYCEFSRDEDEDETAGSGCEPKS